MSKYRLYLGPQQVEVDLLDNSSVTMSTQTKDYESLGVRKSDYVAGLKIVKNNKSDEVIPSHFHVNSTYKASDGLQASLTCDGATLMQGTIFLKESTDEFFKGDLFSTIGSLATVLGDNLVKGNQDPANDLHINEADVRQYSFTMTRDNVRQYMNGTGQNLDYAFSLVNYDGELRPLTNRKEYPLLPALKFRTLVESVLKESGIPYYIDPSIEDDLDAMYVPYNGVMDNLLGSTSYAVNDVQFIANYFDADAYEKKTTLTAHIGALGRLRTTTVDTISKMVAGTEIHSAYKIPSDGDYSFKFHPYGQLKSDVPLTDKDGNAKPYPLKFSIAYLKAGTSDWKKSSFDSVELYSHGLGLHETNEIVLGGLQEGDLISIVQDDVKVADNGSITFDFQLGSVVANSNQNLLNIKCLNYAYSGGNLNLNNILPYKYKKSDVIKDFMNIFNLYMIEESGRIYFATQGSYINTYLPIIDITNKVDSKAAVVSSLCNIVPNKLKFSYTEGDDKLSKDFKDKLGRTFNDFTQVTSCKEEKTESTTTLTTATTVVKKDYDFDFKYAHIVKDKATITNKPRILYLNHKVITDGVWGADAGTQGVSGRIANMYYLSTLDDATDNSLTFSNEYTYERSDSQVFNKTVYNRYYKAETDYLVDGASKLVKVKGVIKGLHLETAYKQRRYFIDLGPRGTFYGKLHKVSGYKPDSGAGVFEFTTLPMDPSYGNYSLYIDTKLLVYTPISATDSFSTTSTTASSSTGAAGDYYTRDYINTHFFPFTGGAITGTTTFEQNVTINGDLRVLGTGSTVDLQTLEVESNEIILNHGLSSAAAPYNGLSGVRVNRGNQEDYLFQFDENSSLFKIGKVSRLQAVATRQDDPLDNTIPYWSRSQRMYMSSGITYQHGTFVDNAGSYFYNNSNSNKEYIPWHAQKMLVGDGTLMEGLIQAKHLNGSYGTILSIDGARRALIGKSGVTQGVALFNGTTEVARTFAQGMIFPRNVDVDGEVKGSLFYTGEVDDLNDIKTNVFRGLEVMRYSDGAANKPVNSNNANGLLNIYSHGTGYGKQIAFGDSDDLYIRRMTAGSFGGWKKLYHSGNANTEDSFWKAKFMRVYDQQVIRGSAANDRLQLWGSAPYMSFWDEASDNRWAYIQANSGNLLLDVAGINNSLDFRVGGFKRGSVGKWGFGVESGSIYRCFGKHGTSWNNYNYADTTRMGALDVQLVNDASASWIWSVRDHSNTFKAGFQTSNNSNYSQLHLTRRLKVTAWDNVFQFYADGVKIAQLDKDGNLRVKGTVEAFSDFTAPLY